jgi:PhoPQ-activated pathogenicity-related protein
VNAHLGCDVNAVRWNAYAMQATYDRLHKHVLAAEAAIMDAARYTGTVPPEACAALQTADRNLTAGFFNRCEADP